ncbi:MAG: LysM peptidoglycan-binding domain-containing protein [Dehalococcoidia bacterium]
MDCYACQNAATNACKRCARPYCEDHGNAEYCSECLKPASALPSFNLYRGALLVMLVGTALAVLLLVRPPGESRGSSPVVVGRSSPTPTASGGTQQPTVRAQTPLATRTPAVATTTAGPTQSPFDSYIVEEGDTLFSIAEQFVPAGDDLTAYLTAIATLNDLDPSAVLSIGQTILLPKQQSLPE